MRNNQINLSFWPSINKMHNWLNHCEGPARAHCPRTCHCGPDSRNVWVAGNHYVGIGAMVNAKITHNRCNSHSGWRCLVMMPVVCQQRPSVWTIIRAGNGVCANWGHPGPVFPGVLNQVSMAISSLFPCRHAALVMLLANLILGLWVNAVEQPNRETFLLSWSHWCPLWLWFARHTFYLHLHSFVQYTTVCISHVLWALAPSGLEKRHL